MIYQLPPNYHQITTKLLPKTTKIHQTTTKLSPKTTTKLSPKTTDTLLDESELLNMTQLDIPFKDDNICDLLLNEHNNIINMKLNNVLEDKIRMYCEKIFSRNDSLQRHLKNRCRFKKNFDEFEKLKERLDNIKTEYDKLKKENDETKISNVINNNYTNNNNTNLNVQLVQFGKKIYR